MTPEQRFWAKVDKSDACWIWTSTTAGQAKYGLFHVGMGPDGPVRQYAHRWSYESFNGPISDGLTIDHICRTPLCVNPAHLEAVTFQENHRRRVGFKHGPYNMGPICPNSS